ncbi:protein NDRG4 [Pseudoliparis swirei]|uniref:protein NDRG4 n=1 Tax=Pseudoliparis swirei TaxID=2059687 RepID=UPI0024BE694B|nr:protein NDRG4 [Pseudoliparis swirei]
MSGMKEQQFTEEKPLLPEQRGVDSDMDKGEEASGGSPRPAPSSQAPPPSRPADRWHVIARHWLRQTRRASGVLPHLNTEQPHSSADLQLQR